MRRRRSGYTESIKNAKFEESQRRERENRIQELREEGLEYELTDNDYCETIVPNYYYYSEGTIIDIEIED